MTWLSLYGLSRVPFISFLIPRLYPITYQTSVPDPKQPGRHELLLAADHRSSRQLNQSRNKPCTTASTQPLRKSYCHAPSVVTSWQRSQPTMNEWAMPTSNAHVTRSGGGRCQRQDQRQRAIVDQRQTPDTTSHRRRLGVEYATWLHYTKGPESNRKEADRPFFLFKSFLFP